MKIRNRNMQLGKASCASLCAKVPELVEGRAKQSEPHVIASPKGAAIYCLVLLVVLLAACSDIGDRDNPLDPGADNYAVQLEESSSSEEDLLSSSSMESSSSTGSSSATDDSSSGENPSEEASSSSEKVSDGSSSSETTNQSSSSENKDAESSSSTGNAPSSSSQKTEASSSSVEEFSVTGLGSCDPVLGVIQKGQSVSWKFNRKADNTTYTPSQYASATYTWDFGDLTADDSRSPLTSGSVTYENAGTYGASVIVKMKDGGTEKVTCSSLQVLDPNAESSSSAEKPVSSASEESSASVQSSSSEIDPPKSSANVQSSSSVAEWTCGDSTITRGDREYATVLINEQCWLKENLQYEPSSGSTLCYGGVAANCEIYGRLYDYEAANLACPTGWRLPTKTELEDLADYSGADMYDAGAHFKAKSGWTGENGDDLLGFTALPSGKCDEEQTCSKIGTSGYWWTSTEKTKNASHYALYLNGDGSSFTAANIMDNDQYISVRCVKK